MLKQINKVQIVGTPYFFIYHNNIPKYITLPQYKIDISDDIKIKMGYIVTSNITFKDSKTNQELNKPEEFINENENENTVDLNCF